MTKNLKLMLVAGARPNFMKLAPLVQGLQLHNATRPQDAPAMDFRIVHTGQHYDARMSQIFFDELGIPAPDFNLEVGSGSHAVQTAEIMRRFEPVCLEARPDWLVVVGDVNSTMACTLVAAKIGIKVAHVEAGLRSYDRTMPEEINRLVTDALADLLLTPSPDADENLKRENVPPWKIRLVGNIMIDSLVRHLETAASEAILGALSIRKKGFIYVTLHRPSNVDGRDTLEPIVRELSHIGAQWPVIFPVHPRTRKKMEEFGLAFAPQVKVQLLDPVGYNESVALTRHARCVLTDSGGLQEESTFFRTPCLTLRPNTERPVTISMGSNRLTTVESLRADLEAALRGPERIGSIPPLWDGKTAPRIVQALIEQDRIIRQRQTA